MIKNAIKRIKKIALSAIVGASVFFSTSAFADGGLNLSTLAKNINTSATLGGNITSYIAYLIGGIFAVVGILILYKSQKNPNDPSATPVKGIMIILIGALLFIVPSLLSVGTSTVGGDSETSGYTNVRFGK